MASGGTGGARIASRRIGIRTSVGAFVACLRGNTVVVNATIESGTLVINRRGSLLVGNVISHGPAIRVLGWDNDLALAE